MTQHQAPGDLFIIWTIILEIFTGIRSANVLIFPILNAVINCRKDMIHTVFIAKVERQMPVVCRRRSSCRRHLISVESVSFRSWSKSHPLRVGQQVAFCQYVNMLRFETAHCRQRQQATSIWPRTCWRQCKMPHQCRTPIQRCLGSPTP